MSLARAAALSVAILLLAPAAARAQCDSNLLIVLDRSCSMNKPPGNGETRSKWQLATQALALLTTKYAGKLRFGLALFPDKTGDLCTQDGPPPVLVGPDHEATLAAALMAAPPGQPTCETNIDTGLAQVRLDPAFAGAAQPGRRSFVLLLTDGKQSGACGGAARDAVTATTIRSLYEAGYPTFVVGFGGAVDPTTLTSFARAGGVGRPGPTPPYYQADGAQDLTAALDAIAGTIATDPEFSRCAGAPCPDGRCFGAGEQCANRVCKAPAPTPATPPDLRVDAGPTGPIMIDAGGCTCQAGGRGHRQAGAWAVISPILASLIARRARRRRVAG